MARLIFPRYWLLQSGSLIHGHLLVSSLLFLLGGSLAKRGLGVVRHGRKLARLAAARAVAAGEGRGEQL